MFAEPGVEPFFDGLMRAGVMGHDVFSFYMSLNPDEEESELMLGAWADTKLEGDLTWHPVVHQRFWSLALDDVLVNGESLGLCGSDRNCLITPDSGTSLVTFPSWAYDTFMDQYGEVVDCEEGWEYEQGDMTFIINGVSYQIPSHHWNERVKTKNSTMQLDGQCYSSIEPLDTTYEGLRDLFIVGDAFMQLYYTVYDREEDRVGFAPAIHTACEKLYHWNNVEEEDYVDDIC